MIDGINELSLSILAEIRNKKSTLKEIAAKFNVSIHQVNKLSRLSNFHISAEKMLDDESLLKLKSLGIKALVFTSLANDKDGLTELLEVADSSMKRDEMAMLPKALEEKRKDIIDKECEARLLMHRLENKEKDLQDRINHLKKLQKESRKAIREFKDMSNEGFEFITDHLGLYKGKYILKKRLDVNWQRTLKNNNIIRYDSSEYVNYINDIPAFKKSVERRIKNKNNIYYDYSKVSDWYNYPTNPEYRVGDKLIMDFKAQIAENNIEIDKLTEERDKAKHKLNMLRKSSSTNYMQQVIVSNALSGKELIRHTKLQNYGLKWLYKEGFVSVAEISQDNYRFDVIGYNDKNEFVIIEAKASYQDFKNDEKVHLYKKYCDKLYLIIDSDLWWQNGSEIERKVKELGIGLLVVKRGNVNLEIETNINKFDKSVVGEIQYKIGRKLAEKYIYSLR